MMFSLHIWPFSGDSSEFYDARTSLTSELGVPVGFRCLVIHHTSSTQGVCYFTSYYIFC